MSVKKFKFVSPGVFINEIDNSLLPDEPVGRGPVIIGRQRKGPAMQPVTVTSLAEFIDVFGEPVPGGVSSDFYRDDNLTSPHYAAYAAQAYLRNSSPVTIVRLLGAEHQDKTTDSGEAGWKTTNQLGDSKTSNGGAFGLFIVNSASVPTDVTGALAAVWYFNTGYIALSGTRVTSSAAAANLLTSGSGQAVLVQSTGDDYQFKARVHDGSSTSENITFNFNPDSARYIRKVFNTNPTLTNSAITADANEVNYWLGESHEKHLREMVTGSASKERWGLILGLKTDDDNVRYSDQRREGTRSRTGWVFSQDLGESSDFTPDAMQKLFRFRSLTGGEWNQRNLKISIEEIKASSSKSDPYGTFTVVLRQIRDNDSAPRIVEKFASCNLNRNSPNYIARKIGDKYEEWDYNKKLSKEYGEYDNQSAYIYVDVDPAVAEGTLSSAEYLPFGFYGVPRFKTISYATGTNISTIEGIADQAMGIGTKTVSELPEDHASGNVASLGTGTTNQAINTWGPGSSFAWEFPKLSMRSSSADGDLPAPDKAYFGFDTTKQRPGTASIEFDDSCIDLLRYKPTPGTISENGQFQSGTYLEIPLKFTLDDLQMDKTHAIFSSGSRRSGASATAVSSSYEQILDNGFDRFTMPLFGGSDGLDITEQDPFRNSAMTSTATEFNNYAYNSISRAISAIADAEVTDYNVATIPGIAQTKLTDKLINTVESRADALAIIDIENGYTPAHENDSDITARRGSVASAISSLKTRNLDSSYACTYYPWVQIKDRFNDQLIWVPPSVVALGTLSSAQATSELWFAPAGFTRGGLTEGSAGLPVMNVRERLTAKDRDKLYEANINPIAKFPAEGIVIFGQKTLQVQRSALDRINVRRLLIFLKKEISIIAATTLFEQNTRETWNNFLGRAEPLLRSVKARLGLDDFKIILDETTTTPDLIDRNIMYAKIFLKPTRAIEFIALDFVITNSGASFED